MGDWDSHLNIFICRTINHLEAQHERLALDTAPDHRVTLSGGCFTSHLYIMFLSAPIVSHCTRATLALWIEPSITCPPELPLRQRPPQKTTGALFSVPSLDFFFSLLYIFRIAFRNG
jgi:hypothetical protein